MAGQSVCSPYFWYQNDESGDLDEIKIWWNNNQDIDLNDFEGVAHHETGHAHGLKHVTWAESFDRDVPRWVAGCSLELIEPDPPIGPHAGRLRSRERDDAAQFAWLFDNGDINANPSFEDTGGWTSDIWDVDGGATLTIYTAGGKRGTNYARLGLGGGVHQTIPLVTPGDFKAKAWARRISQASGTVTISLWAQQIDHDTDGGCEEQYAPMWELDNLSHVGSLTQVAVRTVSLTTADWTLIEIFPSVWTGASGWEGVDIRIRVDNDIAIGVDPWYVDLDWVRIKDKS